MNPLIECLGWTLVHFLWQGVAIALLLAVALRLLRHGPPNHRYLAGCVALFLMASAPAITCYFIAPRLEPSPLPTVEPLSFSPESVDTTTRETSPGPKAIFTGKLVVSRPNFSQRLEMILPWLVVGWFIGVLALSCRLLAGWLQIRRMRRMAIETLAEPWHQKLAELAQRMGIDRPLRLFQSALVEVPAVIGWLRPVILLPASCLAGLSPAQLESILAHELAHIRRHDYLVNLLQSVVETLLFYHPAVWWVSRQIREEREHCCDDIAVKICGDPVAYARALATLEEMRPASAQLVLAANGAPLLQRIQRLLGRSTKGTSSPTWPLAGVVLAIMVMTLAMGLRDNRAMAADSLTPGTFLTSSGVYHYTNENSTMELTIRSNQLRLTATAADATHNTMTGVDTWSPGKHWFLYFATNLQVWAYDGSQGLWQLRSYPFLGSGSASIGWLQECPPAAVLKRLPKAVIKLLPPNKSLGVEGSQPIHSENLETNLAPQATKPDSLEQNNQFGQKPVLAAQDSNTAPNILTLTDGNSSVSLSLSGPSAGMNSWTVDGQNQLSDQWFYYRVGDSGAPASVGVYRKGLETPVSEVHFQSDALVTLYRKGLETRTFHLDTERFLKALEQAGFFPGNIETNVNLQTSGGPWVNGGPSLETRRIHAAIHQLFKSLGVDIGTNSPGVPGTAIFFNERKGVLLVRATAKDLDIIAPAIEALNGEKQATAQGVKNASEPAVPANSTSSPPSTKDEPELLIRTYPIDTHALLERVGNRYEALNADGQSRAEQALQKRFAAAGLDFHAINSANTNVANGYILNFKTDMLLVRSKKSDIGKVNEILAKLAPKPQLNIKVKFVEIDEAASKTKGLDWLFKDNIGHLVSNNAGKSPLAMPTSPIPPGASISYTNIKVIDAIQPLGVGILTGLQFNSMIKALEERGGVDELTVPEITTESGRQAQVQAVDIQTVVVGPCPTNNNGRPQTETLPFGPTVDLIPTVSNDGYSIEVKAIATVTEFLGYEVPRKGGGSPEVMKVPNRPVSVAVPMVRLRQMAARAAAYDGQTIVLGGLGPEIVSTMTDKVPVLGDIPLLGRVFRSKSTTKTKKNLLVFITPTLINPDGSRYHSDKEWDEARFSVPPAQTGRDSVMKDFGK